MCMRQAGVRFSPRFEVRCTEQYNYFLGVLDADTFTGG